MGVDLNFNNITYTIDLNSNLVSIGVIPFRGVSVEHYIYRKLAEELQKKHPRNWRFLKWARRIRARWLSKRGVF